MDANAGDVPVKARRKRAAKKQRKVAILGTTPSRMEAPLKDDDWEIWTIGPGGMDLHRWDRLFEIHGSWPEEFADYLNSLSSRGKDPHSGRQQYVYSVYPMSARMHDWAASNGKDEKWLAEKIQGDWKNNVVIDRESLFEKHRRMWFSSSISYCIALALEEGVREIGLFGIDLESGEEYISQHTGAAHFLDLARHLGCDIHMPVGCGLSRDLSPYPDRYETHLAQTLEKKHAYLDHLIKTQEPEYEGQKMMVFRTEGVLLRTRELMEIFSRDPNALQKELHPEKLLEYERILGQHNEKLGQMAGSINHLKGEQSATQYYRRMYCWGMVEPT
jgi:hypothetical protein